MDLSTSFRWGPSRDPPEISQDPFGSLENTALADAGALQGPSRDSPGTPTHGPLMDADRLPVGMVAFGSVACVIVIQYLTYTYIYIYTYVFMYLHRGLCIYVCMCRCTCWIYSTLWNLVYVYGILRPFC